MFDARLEDIDNFYHLIKQRVSEQAECTAEKTEVVLYLSDGTSRRLPSFDDFKNYAETSPAVPTLINLGISLWIKFRETDTPEKQHIDISIRPSDILMDHLDSQVEEDRARFASDKMQLHMMASRGDLGIISYTIEHSRISWGLDIENLIQNHCKKFTIPASSSDKVLKRLRNPLHLITTITLGTVVANQFIDLLFKFLFETEGAPENTSITDIASTWLTNGHIAKYIVMSLFASVILVVLISTISKVMLKNLHKPRPSFIILSQRDEDRREIRLEKHKKRWARVGLVVTLNIAAIVVTVLFEDRILTFWKLLTSSQ